MLTGLGFGDVRTFRESVRGTIRVAVYAIPPLVVLAGTSDEQTTNIESGSIFWCTSISSVVLIAATNVIADPTVTPYPDIQIEDSASGADLLSRDNVRAGGYLGSAGCFRQVTNLDQPHGFDPGAVITVLVNNIAAVDLEVQLAFGGYKVYR